MSQMIDRYIALITQEKDHKAHALTALLSLIHDLGSVQGITLGSIYATLQARYIRRTEQPNLVDDVNSRIASDKAPLIHEDLVIQMMCTECFVTAPNPRAFFFCCDDCTKRLASQAVEQWGFCNLHPGCDCKVPSECVQESTSFK